MSHAGPRAPRRPGGIRRAVRAVQGASAEDRRGCLVVLWFVFAGLLLLASGLAAGVFAIQLPGAITALHDDTVRRADAERVQGRVEAVRETLHDADPAWTEYTPSVRFRSCGRTDTVLLRDDSADEPGVYRVGQTLDLMVDTCTTAPPRVRSDRIRDELVGSVRTDSVGLGVSVAVFVPLLVAAVRWSRRQDREQERWRVRRAQERLEERERERERERDRERDRS